MSDVKRYEPGVFQPDNFRIFGVMREAGVFPSAWVDDDSTWVRSSDYDALRAELAVLKESFHKVTMAHAKECKKVERLKVAAAKVTCSYCDGTGRVDDELTPEGEDSRDCPDCADLRALLGDKP